MARKWGPNIKMTKSLIFVERALEVWWQRIEVTCRNDARSLGLFRIFWGLYILLFFAPYSAWVSLVPQAFYKPPVLSPAILSPGFPPYWLMLAADLLRIWLLVLITIGIKTRLCTIVLCLLSVICTNFVYSFGKIDHDILVWAVGICLAFTDWGVLYALLPDRSINPKVAARALATAGVLIAFAMFSAGFGKALRWINLDFSTSGFLSWFNPGYYTLGRTYLLAPIVPKIPPPLIKIADYAAVAFELSPFLFLFAGRIGWRVWLLVAAIFHLANALLLNIPFYFHVLVYFPFLALSRFVSYPESGDNAALPVYSWRIPVVVFSVVLGIAHTAQRLSGGGGQFLFMAGSEDLSPLMLYGPLPLLAFCFVIIAIDLTRCIRAN
jgi:hypothetical protein